MVRKTIMALCAVVMMPLAAAAQQDGFEKHFLHGEGLYRMERYSEAYDEFRQAWCSVASCADDALFERVFYFGAVSAAKGERGAAEELLRNYIAKWPEGPGVAEVRFELGCIFFAREDYAAAMKQYAAIKARTLPSECDDEYDFKYGYSCFKLDMFDEAVEAMARIDFKSDYYPHAQYVLGYAEYRRGDYAAAKRYFTVIADHPAYRDIVPFYIIQIEFNDQNYYYVRENCGAVLRMATGERLIELNRIAGESWFLTGGWRETVQYLKRYAELGGHMGREENYMIGFSDYMTGEYEEAEQYLSLASGPDDKLTQNASYHLADCYLRMGKKQQALQSFAMAAAEGYDDTISEDALFNYGKLQYELGGGAFNEAITTLSNYVAQYPNSPQIDQARELLLAAYFNSRNYEAAYEAINQIRNPDNNVKSAKQKIAYFRALECFQNEDYNQALVLFNVADANRFNAKYTALTKFWRAETYARQGNYAKAIPLYKDYITLSPGTEYENKVAHYNLGYCYFNTQRWADAANSFHKFLAVYSTRDNLRADAYNRLGDAAFAQRDYREAVNNYDQAIRLNAPATDYAQFQRAVMLGLLDQRDRKIESLRDIVSSGKGDYVDDAMYELGRTYVQAEKFNDGASVLKRLIAKYPDSPYYLPALSQLGLTYQNLGNSKEALHYYKQIVAEFPSSRQAKDAMLSIRNIYVDNNDVDSYVSYAKSSGVEMNVTLVERDSLSFAAANRIYQNGDYAKALNLMDNYLRQNPKGSFRIEALYALGDCSLREGNRQGAIAAFEEVGSMPTSEYKVPALQQAAKMQLEDKNYSQAATTPAAASSSFASSGNHRTGSGFSPCSAICFSIHTM